MIHVEDIVRAHIAWPMPRFLLRVVERLVHEREINALLQGGEGLSAHDFLKYVFKELDVRAQVNYRAALDPSCRYLFVSNHPFGALDGMLLADMLLERWSDVGVVVNELLMHIAPLRELWVPVRKYARQSAGDSAVYHAALASERQILTFPAGLCSRWIDGRVTDLGWHSRFVRDAERYGRQVVPVYVDGVLSSRFYYIYRLRRALRISLNLELLLLVDELFAQRGRRVRIEVGQPVDVHSLSGNVVERCRAIRQQVYALSQSAETLYASSALDRVWRT